MTIIYYIGLNDKDTKEQEITSMKAESILDKLFTNAYPLGFTRTNAIGRYKHNDGHIVSEETIIYTVLDTKIVDYKLIDDIKSILNQESVAVQVITNDVVSFI